MIRWLVGGWGGSVKKAAARRLRRASRTPPGGSEGSRRSYSPQSAAWAAQKCVSASRPRIRSCPFTAIPYFPPPGPGCRLVGRGERRRLDHRRHARDGARVQRRVEERRRRSVERGGAHAVGGGRGRRRAARGAAGAAGTGVTRERELTFLAPSFPPANLCLVEDAHNPREPRRLSPCLTRRPRCACADAQRDHPRNRLDAS